MSDGDRRFPPLLALMFFLLAHGVGAPAAAASGASFHDEFVDLHRYVVQASGETAGGGEPMSPEACLACHGPWEALRDRSSGYVAPSGVPVNPHITYDRTRPSNPHASGEGLIECTQCHQQHPLPIVEPLPPANIDMCIACHHTGTFRSCADCH